MEVRTKKLLLLCLVVISGLCIAACTFNQPPRFRNSFLPPSAAPSIPSNEIAEPPVVQPNPFLHDAPAVLTQAVMPSLRAPADALMRKAEQHYQKGRKYYQAGDTDSARKEFDAAVDLMISASEQNPAAHEACERKLDQMVEAIYRFDLAGLGASADVEEARFEKAPLEDLLQMTFPVDPKLKDRVREQVAATVSQLPLSVTNEVLGYIQYFSTRGHKTIVAGLQRAARYRPMIQRIFDEEGVPQELIHLAQAESGFIPRARSRMAAVGMWQFVAFRGREYGLNQTQHADERMDPEKSTRAAARHLRDLYNNFGDWYLAIAAYNCGPVAVERAVERTGYADFWELRRRGVLPAETTNYVPIILAMTIMAKNAAEYGLNHINPEAPLEYETVEISSPTHLALVSDLTETPVAQLMEMNPALLRPLAPEGYSLHVPKGSASTLAASLELVPAERRRSWRVHKVGYGETIASIGKRYSTPPASIASVNSLSAGDEVKEGDRLLIPAAYQEPRGGVRKAASRAPARRATTRRASAARPSGATVTKASATAKSKSGVRRTVYAHRASR